MHREMALMFWPMVTTIGSDTAALAAAALVAAAFGHQGQFTLGLGQLHGGGGAGVFRLEIDQLLAVAFQGVRLFLGLRHRLGRCRRWRHGGRQALAIGADGDATAAGLFQPGQFGTGSGNLAVHIAAGEVSAHHLSQILQIGDLVLQAGDLGILIAKQRRRVGDQIGQRIAGTIDNAGVRQAFQQSFPGQAEIMGRLGGTAHAVFGQPLEPALGLVEEQRHRLDLLAMLEQGADVGEFGSREQVPLLVKLLHPLITVGDGLGQLLGTLGHVLTTGGSVIPGQTGDTAEGVAAQRTVLQQRLHHGDGIVMAERSFLIGRGDH